MLVNKIVTQEAELEIMGATLLSAEEANTLPYRLTMYHTSWWLRSPGDDQDTAAYVNGNGVVRESGDGVFNNYNVVRPALIINLKNSNFTIGDCFIFKNKEFEIVSDNSAFCKNDIGFCCFRQDYKAEDANIYEASDIKKYIDTWFA